MQPIQNLPTTLFVRSSLVGKPNTLTERVRSLIHAVYAAATRPFHALLPVSLLPSIRQINTNDLQLLLKISQYTPLTSQETERLSHLLSEKGFFERLDLKTAVKTHHLFHSEKIDTEKLIPSLKALADLSRFLRQGGRPDRIFKDLNEGKRIDQHFCRFQKIARENINFDRRQEGKIFSICRQLLGLELLFDKHFEGAENLSVWKAFTDPASNEAKRLEHFFETAGTVPITDYSQSFTDNEWTFYCIAIAKTPCQASVPRVLPPHTKQMIESINRHSEVYDNDLLFSVACFFARKRKALHDFFETRGGRDNFYRHLEVKIPSDTVIMDVLNRLKNAFTFGTQACERDPYHFSSFKGEIDRIGFYPILKILGPISWFAANRFNKKKKLERLFLTGTLKEIRHIGSRIEHFCTHSPLEWTKSEWLELIEMAPLLQEMDKMNEAPNILLEIEQGRFKWNKEGRNRIKEALLDTPTVLRNDEFQEACKNFSLVGRKWTREEKKTVKQILELAKEVYRKHRNTDVFEMLPDAYNQKIQGIHTLISKHQTFIHYLMKFPFDSFDKIALEVMKTAETKLEKVWCPDWVDAEGYVETNNFVHWEEKKPLDLQTDSECQTFLRHVYLNTAFEQWTKSYWPDWYTSNRSYHLACHDFKKNDLFMSVQSAEAKWIPDLFKEIIDGKTNPFPILMKKMKIHLEAAKKEETDRTKENDKILTAECLFLYLFGDENNMDVLQSLFSEEFCKTAKKWYEQFGAKDKEDFINIVFYRSRVFSRALKEFIQSTESNWEKYPATAAEPLYRRFMEKHFPYGHANFVFHLQENYRAVGIWDEGVYHKDCYSTYHPKGEQYSVHPEAFFPKDVEKTQDKLERFANDFFFNLSTPISSESSCKREKMRYPQGEVMKRALGWNRWRTIDPSSVIAGKKKPGKDAFEKKEAFCSQFIALKLIEAAKLTYQNEGYSFNSLEQVGFHRGENLDAMHPKKLRDKLLKAGAIKLKSRVQNLVRLGDEDDNPGCVKNLS